MVPMSASFFVDDQFALVGDDHIYVMIWTPVALETE
jgi:hypothetical protein